MMRLTGQLQNAIQELWSDLSEFSAAETDNALRHLMAKLSELLRADNVVWIGAVRLSSGAKALRDPQLGWRVRAVRHLHLDAIIAERSDRATREQDHDPGLTTRALAAQAGELRVCRLHDGFVDLAKFKATAHYRAFYQELGIVDRMYIGIPVNQDAESFLLLDRKQQSPRFSSAEAQLVTLIMHGLNWLHRELLLSHGLLIAREPLISMERRILQLLLTECTEKEIAARLSQSPKTTHKYISGIFRKFAVRGRTGLMALWLERNLRAPAPPP